MKTINLKVKNNEFTIGDNSNLIFIGGPCAIESLDHSLFMAEAISKICKKLDINWIFKACYDKDCRSSPDSFHGLGMTEGLEILNKVRDEFEVPVTSDFSDPSWAKETGEVCDILQIPAYLCRQTSILRAAAKTNKPVNLKKGQFMSPWNMKNSVKKLEFYGCNNIILTDRGTFFGYNMLVNDIRSLPIMRESGYPVCFDATHSVQQPGGLGEKSGGQREFVEYLSRAAVAVGVAGLFIETHQDPDNAPSDGPNMLPLDKLENLLKQLTDIDKLIKNK